jgi:ubiquinone/menaquinone biosynthesis C-methylase UbiE
MDRPALYRELYEYEADVYRITDEAEDALAHRRNLVRRILPSDPGPAILDVGCGDGAISAALAEATGARVVGTDLAEKRVRFAREHAPAGRFAQGSVYDLPFADGAFDTVVCTDLLEHLDDPQRAVRELVRVSSRWVLVTVPYSIEIEKTLCPHCLNDYYLYGHQHSFGVAGVERLAVEAGGRLDATEHLIPMFECRRYRWFPPLKWLLWDHFKNTGTLGARIAK